MQSLAADGATASVSEKLDAKSYVVIVIIINNITALVNVGLHRLVAPLRTGASPRFLFPRLSALVGSGRDRHHIESVDAGTAVV